MHEKFIYLQTPLNFDLDQDQRSRMARIMVHQRNPFQGGFIGSFDAL